jgi:hypothetical protein
LEIRAERREQVSGRSLGGVVVDRWPIRSWRRDELEAARIVHGGHGGLASTSLAVLLALKSATSPSCARPPVPREPRRAPVPEDAHAPRRPQHVRAWRARRRTERDVRLRSADELHDTRRLRLVITETGFPGMPPHLQSCASCREEYDSLRDLVRATDVSE